ncbi:FecR domain-containing protein [Hoeflea sp. CAU 1731]
MALLTTIAIVLPAIEREETFAFAQTSEALTGALALEDEFVTISMLPGANLRDIAAEYLDDPDLWPIILSLNNISDVTEIAEGQELQLPTSQLQTAVTALAASLESIQLANEAGAQLFAPILIRNAITLRDEAIREKQNGVYKESILLSSRSIDRAESARKKSQENRDVEAEARLSDRQGWVEGQKIQENSWTQRELNAVLNEQEKLRTLSSSTAQVVFRDASRLRLNANSQAVIERMRADPLQRSEDAQISLVQGDFYALLASETNRNRLEVNLPNADATIDSGSFWVSQDQSGAKFSNFDVKPVSVTAAGETTVLGRNEGAVIRNGRAPEEKVKIQGRVHLLSPDEGAVIYGNNAELVWESIGGGEQYWVEIAYDPRFDRMEKSLFGIDGAQVGNLELDPGSYFWRVAAIDAFGLPGQMSTVRKFEVRFDDTPPFLKILAPGPDAILRKASVTLEGETEPEVEIIIEGDRFEIGPDGRFGYEMEAVEGENSVRVTAIDRAGNETQRIAKFTYLRDENTNIAFDSALIRDERGRFLTAGETLTLSGKVKADAKISVLDAGGAIRSETYAEPDGAFLVNIPLASDEENLAIRVTSPSGHAYEEPLEAIVLDTAPAIRFSSPPPLVTSEPLLRLAVETDQPASVIINGQEARAKNGAAHVEIELQQGPNLIETVATNAVGLVTIDKRTVIFDTEAPTITLQNIEVTPKGDTTLVSLNIGASDASGLAKTSRFNIRSGDQQHNGVLRFNKIRKAYQGSTEIPIGEGEMIFEIEIADVAGNVNNVRLVQ